MKETIFHPEAREEIREARGFYEAHLEGLGLRFLEAVEGAAERISADPEAGSPLAGGFRKRRISAFPCNIICRVRDDRIYFVAAAHHHRRPGYWRGRAARQ